MPNYESYQVIKEITLDLVAPGLAPVVNVPQYDTKGRVVKVNLVSNSAAYETAVGRASGGGFWPRSLRRRP